MSNIVIPEVIDRPIEPFPQAVLVTLPKDGKNYEEEVAAFVGHNPLPGHIRVIGPEEVVKITNPVAYFGGEEPPF